eukprot:gene16224-22389_t
MLGAEEEGPDVNLRSTKHDQREVEESGQAQRFKLHRGSNYASSPDHVQDVARQVGEESTYGSGGGDDELPESERDQRPAEETDPDQQERQEKEQPLTNTVQAGILSLHQRKSELESKDLQGRLDAAQYLVDSLGLSAKTQ